MLYLSHGGPPCPKDAPLRSVSATGTESSAVRVSVTLHGAGCSEATTADAATPAKYTYGGGGAAVLLLREERQRGRSEHKVPVWSNA